MWDAHLRPGHQVLDGQRIELGGWTFGFVGGGLRSPYRTPHELDEEDYAAKVAAIGPVDVLCAHITVAERMEVGSTALLDAIKVTQPRYALFGHVHQPLVSRVRIGRTECVNVGHFRATGQPFVLCW
jgi:Icc-related predicted phosphoesterase